MRENKLQLQPSPPGGEGNKKEKGEKNEENEVAEEVVVTHSYPVASLRLRKEDDSPKSVPADTTSFLNLTRLGFSFDEATLVGHVAQMESAGLCEFGLTANIVMQSCSIEVMRRNGLDGHMADKMQLALGMPRRGTSASVAELMNGRWPWRLILTLMMGTSGTELSMGLFYVRGFGLRMEWLRVETKSVELPMDMAEFYSQFVANNFFGNCGEMSDKIIAFTKKAGFFASAQVTGWLKEASTILAGNLPLKRSINRDCVDLISTLLVTARFTTSPITVSYMDFNGATKEKSAYGILTFMEPEDIQVATGIPVYSRPRQSDQAVGNSGAPLAGMQDEVWECPMLLEAYHLAETVLHINGGGQANGHALTRSGISVGDDFGPCAGLINQVAEVTIGNFYDPDGQNAAQGNIIPEFFTKILRKYLGLGQMKAGNEGIKEYVKFLADGYMKSAGTDPDARTQMACDLLATVTEVVAVILISKIGREIVPVAGIPEVVELSGGAWWNKHLTNRFKFHWGLLFAAELAREGKKSYWTTFEKMHPGTGCRNDSKEDLLSAQLAQMASAGHGFVSVATGGGFVIPGTVF